MTAPAGVVYGPTDIEQRILDHAENSGGEGEDWSGLDIPPERRVINPIANWCAAQDRAGRAAAPGG